MHELTKDVRGTLARLLIAELDYDIEPAEIKDSTSLVGKGLALASVDLVSLVIKLEDEFEVFFEGEEVAAATRTFGELVTIIENKLQESVERGHD